MTRRLGAPRVESVFFLYDRPQRAMRGEGLRAKIMESIFRVSHRYRSALSFRIKSRRGLPSPKDRAQQERETSSRSKCPPEKPSPGLMFVQAEVGIRDIGLQRTPPPRDYQDGIWRCYSTVQ